MKKQLAAKTRMKGILRPAAIIGLLATGLIPPASADQLTLTDGRRFSAVLVVSYASSATGPVFQAKLGQPDGTWSAAYPINAQSVQRIEFRGAGDTGTRPIGRIATLLFADGRRFEYVAVESYGREGEKAVFYVRQAGSRPTDTAFPVPAELLSQAGFETQGVMAVPTIPAMPPAPAAPPAQAQPPVIPIPTPLPYSQTTSDDTPSANVADSFTEEEDATSHMADSFQTVATSGKSGLLAILGSGLFYLGLVVCGIMGLWMWVLMFQTGILWGLSQFVPCVSNVVFIIWLIQNWSEAKIPFLISVAGAFVAVLGAFLSFV